MPIVGGFFLLLPLFGVVAMSLMHFCMTQYPSGAEFGLIVFVKSQIVQTHCCIMTLALEHTGQSIMYNCFMNVPIHVEGALGRRCGFNI